MPLSKLWPGFAVGFLFIAAACGGGGSTTVPAAPTTAPTATPTATPTPAPGPLQVAYTSSFGATSAATAAPAAIVFGAETQTVSVTATQANNVGGYSAAANSACGTNVTVTPATSATGAFTITAVTPVTVAAACQVTITGEVGTAAVAVGASVPAPGGVTVGWVAMVGYKTLPAPVSPQAGPINLIGVTSTFGAVLVVSETHYVKTFGAPVLSAGCGANLSAPTTTTQGPIAGPSAALGQTQVYYLVAAPSAAVAFASSAGCTISVSDTQTVPSTGTIGVSLTTTGGGII